MASMTSSLVAALMVLIVPLAVALVVTTRRVSVDDRDIAWLAGGALPRDPAVRHVYCRYLRRHRVHRAVGGWLGALVAIAYGVSADRGLYVGIGAGGPLGDILFCGLAGLVAGALSAEVYRVAARPGPAVASLAPRPQPRQGGTVLLGRLLVLGSLAGAVAGAVRTGAVLALGAAVGGAVVVGMAEAARRAIADRRRPVLSPTAVEVDTRIRGYASEAVARLELAAGALTAGWVVGSALPPELARIPGLVEVLTLGLLIAALVELHRARPRPARTFTPQAAPLVPIHDRAPR